MKTSTAARISSTGNLNTLRANPEWAKLPLFDRTGWKRLSFGAFAESVNERVDPSEAGDETYVGLEHLDPQDLHIRRWGKGSDVIGTKLRFRKGDVIFGRRRAYQRKLAIAEFAGICSAHAMVVRAKPELVLPEFLPFLMMSDRFMKRAVEISVGSLSPTINWKTLKLEEFALPPLAQQRRLAEILWTVDKALQSNTKLQSSLSVARDAFFDDKLRRGTIAEPETLSSLGHALTDIVAGKSPKASSNPASNSEFGVLKVSAAGDGVFCEEENKALLDAADFVPALEVKPGMILVTRCNALLSGIGRACLVEKTRPGLMLSDKTLQLVADSNVIDQDFLIQSLRREPYRGYVERSANGTEAKNITQNQLRAAPFWVPSLKIQHAIVERLRSFGETIASTSNNCHTILRLRDSLMNIVVS